MFRFGPTFGAPDPDEQFPVEAMDRFAKQMVPDLNAMLPAPNPTKGAVRFGSELKGRRSDGSFRIRRRFIGSSSDQCIRN